MTPRRSCLAAVLLVYLMLCAGACSEPGGSLIESRRIPFEGSWVDFVDPTHTLEVTQAEFLGEAGGTVTGTESFGPDGPASPFSGPFFEREMVITIERPDGPRTFVGEMLDPDMMLMTSERPDEFLLVRRPEDSR